MRGQTQNPLALGLNVKWRVDLAVDVATNNQGRETPTLTNRCIFPTSIVSRTSLRKSSSSSPPLAAGRPAFPPNALLSFAMASALLSSLLIEETSDMSKPNCFAGSLCRMRVVSLDVEWVVSVHNAPSWTKLAEFSRSGPDS